MMLRLMSRERVKRLNNVSPSPQRMARCSTERSSEKRPSISSTASLLLRNTSRHMVGIGRGDAGEIAKAAGREFDHFGIGHFLDIGGGRDDVIGDEMRQMAGDGEHQIVMLGVHDLDIGAAGAPEIFELLHRLGIAVGQRRQDAPAIGEEFGKARFRARLLGAGHRMARHEMDVRRQMRRDIADDRRLDRADIGDDRAFLESRADLARDLAAGADRHAQDDEIGIAHRCRGTLMHAVDKPDLDRLGARRRRSAHSLQYDRPASRGA